MNDNSVQKTRTHNTVVGIITIAAIGTIAGSIALNWEFWVPPLIVIGLIAAWFMHITQYGSYTFRENYYLIFSMLLSFYHGIHPTSFFEIVVVSTVLMVNVTLLRRKEFVLLMLAEFFVLMTLQIVMAVSMGSMVFDRLTVSKISLHIISEFCIYKGLSDAIKNNHRDREELEARNSEKETERTQMEDFLVNISHELRTPVNVINGMSTLILKKEDREDVVSIKEAGLRLSRQIEDIQDYSEIQRGDVFLNEDNYEISSLTADVVSDYRSLDDRGDIKLIVDLDPNVPAVLKGDSDKISKIISHLLDNAVKFTKKGGVFLRITCIKRDYGINLVVEVTDTGIGMTAKEIESITGGSYGTDKKRNASTGGIGLGYSIVYGFVRKMNGFATIESAKNKGTKVRVSIAQQVIDPTPCIVVKNDRFINLVFFMIPGFGRALETEKFYRQTATDLASGLKVNLYLASDISEVKKLIERGDITHVFMGFVEYDRFRGYFNELAQGNTMVVVYSPEGIENGRENRVVFVRETFSGVSAVRVINGDTPDPALSEKNEDTRPVFNGVSVLVVDDEPMNLVVAKGLFSEYNMIVDTADSGREALEKYEKYDYDLVFMDHMMPEMDGVEAMKKIRETARHQGKTARVIALTANAISGAREMFMREGFDGFISKPIKTNDFEKTVKRVLPAGMTGRGRGRM